MNKLRSPLEPVVSLPEATQRVGRSLLDGPRHFSLSAMRDRGWVVAAIPDSISDAEAGALASIAAARGIPKGVAWTTEVEVNEECVQVPLTEEGLLAFELNCYLRTFLLVPESVDFALLHEGNYYWLLAGDVGFLTAVLGMSPRDALRVFLDDYVAQGDWPQNTSESLTAVERYLTLL